jgi:hypothetical protein
MIPAGRAGGRIRTWSGYHVAAHAIKIHARTNAVVQVMMPPMDVVARRPGCLRRAR